LYKITPNYNSNHENAKLPLTSYAKVLRERANSTKGKVTSVLPLYIFPHIQVDRYRKERRITKIASAKFPIMQHHSLRRRRRWGEREKMQPT
jgi:hypothetical protein